MSELETTRVALPTGVTLKVQFGGREDAPPLVLLHGFPESHRTWRHQVTNLVRDFRVIVPDQRGFGGSDKPEDVDAYRTDEIIADLLALADAFGFDRFTLVGHDWGGAVAWGAALKHPDRIARLVIVNAPHPLIFQRTLIDDPAQRAASQYIRAFREPGMEAGIRAMGLDTFFDKSFAKHVDVRRIAPAERQAYLDDWGGEGALTAMLNWYRASAIAVPAVGEHAGKPLWTLAPFPTLEMPVLVIWGLEDKALLPVQLDGLDALCADLRIVLAPDAGHFVPWEQPEMVTSAIRDFMAEA